MLHLKNAHIAIDVALCLVGQGYILWKFRMPIVC